MSSSPGRIQNSDDQARHRVVQSSFTQDALRWREEYERRDFASRKYRLRAAAAREMLQRISGNERRLLDVGCGAGLQAESAAREGWRVVGVDLTLAMVRQAARATSGTVRWVVAAAEALPFRAGSFDAALMLGLIGYVADPLTALRTVRRCLRDRGYLIVSWHCRATLLGIASRMSTFVPRRLRAFYRRATGRPSMPTQSEDTSLGAFYDRYNRSWRGHEFRELLQSAGLRQWEERVIDFGQLRFFGLALWPDVIDIVISRAIETLAHLPPFQFLKRWAMMHVVLSRVVNERPT